MILYETRIRCSWCKTQWTLRRSKQPCTEAEALELAKAKRWERRDDGDVCPECLSGKRKWWMPPPETVAEKMQIAEQFMRDCAEGI